MQDTLCAPSSTAQAASADATAVDKVPSPSTSQQRRLSLCLFSLLLLSGSVILSLASNNCFFVQRHQLAARHSNHGDKALGRARSSTCTTAVATSASHPKSCSTAWTARRQQPRVREGALRVGNETTAMVPLEKSPTRKYHIFQVSPPDSGSTMIWNVLTGLLEGRNQSSSYLECKKRGGSQERKRKHHGGLARRTCRSSYQEKFFKGHGMLNQTIVTKTHFINVDELTQRFGHMFDALYFVATTRKEKNKLVPVEYCRRDDNDERYKNVLCLEYNDVLYSNEQELLSVVRFVGNKIRTSFPDDFGRTELLEREAVERMLDFADYLAAGDFARSNPSRQKYGGSGSKGFRNRTVPLRQASS